MKMIVVWYPKDFNSMIQKEERVIAEIFGLRSKMYGYPVLDDNDKCWSKA